MMGRDGRRVGSIWRLASRFIGTIPVALSECTAYTTPSRPSSLRASGRDRGQDQPSSFIARPACQILVMWTILSPSNCMT